MLRFLLLFSTLLILPAALPANARADESGCRRLEHAGGRYIACSFDPAKAEIRLFNRNAAGVPYGGFVPLFRDLLSRFELPVFAMNGGMYEEDLSPVGLYVEKGVTLKPANTRKGPGNFHLKPNGVFWLKAGRAGVSETGAFVHHGGLVDYATQSGPMLVLNGRLHPLFKPDSDSLKIRNGVGVDKAGLVHFAISEDSFRFYDMATLFRDVLKTPNALFLDGSISSLYAPELGRFDGFYPVGPIVTVTIRLPWHGNGR